MARLDDDLAKALADANDKLEKRTRKASPSEKAKHLKPELKAGGVAAVEGERLFSSVFGFTPPSGIDHVCPDFNEDSWDERVRPYIPDIDFNYILPEVVTEEAVVAILRNKPLLIIGQKGSGKTSLQQQICARLRLPWFRINCRRDMESSSFFGTPSLKQGDLGWVDGPLPLFGRYGGLVTADEASAMPSGIALALMSPLEPNGPIYIPEKPEGDRYIKPCAWFRLGATDNTQLQGDTTGRYAGTNVQNEALIDRFRTTLKLDYLSSEHETRVIKSQVPQVPDDWVASMLGVAALVRRGYDQGTINFTMSLRGLISWADDAVYWGDIARSFKLSFANKLIEDDLKQVIEIFLKVTDVDLNKL